MQNGSQLIIIQDEPITKGSSYGQSYAQSSSNTLDNNVKFMFKQRSAAPPQGYSNFMEKYKFNNHQDESSLLNKYRPAKPIEIEDDQPLKFKKKGESP